MKNTVPLLIASAVCVTANIIPEGFHVRERLQNVLGNNHYHPILDEYLQSSTEPSDFGSLTPEVSEAWEYLEKAFDRSVIEDAIKSYTPDFASNSLKSAPKIPELIDTKNFEYITAADVKNYGLRVNRHADSDPASLGVDTVKQWSGYFDLNEEDKHLFFWFFESRNDPVNDPVILWLNGGPGCSSMTGLFFELGPSSINGTTLKPIYNPYSWNSNASVIFLEQPVGVGYSYAEKSTTSTTQQAAEDVYAFLQLFFTRFNSFASNDFHIAGESYAGHYIPNIASVITQKRGKVFNLSSVMIGNGITDALTQYYYYIPMACNATESGYKQLVSDEECEDMEKIYSRCKLLINSCYHVKRALTCVPANLYCETITNPFDKTGLNYYDIREPCDGDGCYPQIAAVESYLNKPEVMEALGSEVTRYVGCDDKVFRRFILSGDEPKPFQQYIVDLLELDIPVLIYAGDKDYICNWLGNKAWTDDLQWSGYITYQNAETRNWTSKIDGQDAGTVKSNGLLTFLRVFDAGHMVPFNQPSNSLDMVNRWISGDYKFES